MKSRSLHIVMIASLVLLTCLLFGFAPSELKQAKFAGDVYYQLVLMALLIISVLSVCAIIYQNLTLASVSRRAGRSPSATLDSARTTLLKLATSESASSANFDRAIRDLLKIAADSLSADKVAIWLFACDTTQLSCKYLYERVLSPAPGHIHLAQHDAPLYFSRIRSLLEVSISAGSSDPLVKELQRFCGPKLSALMDIPLKIHGKPCGVLCISQFHPEPTRFSAKDKTFARSLADTLAMTFEISAQKRIESELSRKSKAIEAALDGIAIVDAREKISFANHAFAVLFGYSSAEALMGREWLSLFHTEEAQRMSRCLKYELKTQGQARLEGTALRCDGQPFDFELSLTTLGSGDFVGVIRDISRRKKAEQELRESKMFLRKVIDTDPNFIFVKDAEGRFFLVNQSLADAYGSSVEGIVGKTDADFNSNTEEVAHFRKDDLFVIKHQSELVIAEEKVTDSTGKQRWLQTVKRPLKLPNDSRTYVLGVAADITERKLLQNQLLQSQKMEAVGQLAGGIAHDFNNMMTGILGYTSLLKMSCEKQPGIIKHVDLIERAALRASELTQKLLGFARRGKHQNIPINLHTSIRETVAILARTIEKNIKITLKLRAENPFIRGDPTQIQQVILNLALNARDAIRMKSGGELRGELSIQTKLLTSPADGRTSLRGIELSVSDSGCGIAPQHLHRIFEPFFTTKEQGKGTGMGLAMVYGIVENHDGTIEVTSALGVGSSFIVRFPSVAEPLAAAVQKSVSDVHSGKGHILIVDDHTVVRDVTAQMLSSLGYQVVTARDGLDALEYYRENQSDIDLVVLDLVMPRMGARECFREMKRINPRARAILSTGYVNNNAVQELLNEGIAGFVQKPYQIARLSEVVAEALKH